MTAEPMIHIDGEYRVTFTKTIIVPLDTLDYELSVIDEKVPQFEEDEYADPEWEERSGEIVFTRIFTG